MKSVSIFLLSVFSVVAYATDRPYQAQVGKCYAKVYVEATYKLQKVRRIVKPASVRTIHTPAKCRYVNKTVVMKAASERVEMVPAQYRTVNQSVKVKDEVRKQVTTPAQYKTVQAKVLVRPARKVWKKGTSTAIQKVDAKTGDVLCLVEEPAVYKTVKKRVMVRPESSRSVVVTPAQYKKVSKRVLIAPARAQVVNVPAVTKTIRVKETITPASERHIQVPAEYGIVERKVVDQPAYSEWKAVVCQNKMTKDLVSRVQSSLEAKGYYFGGVNGTFDGMTKDALQRYQAENGIAAGGYLTEETLVELGIVI